MPHFLFLWLFSFCSCLQRMAELHDSTVGHPQSPVAAQPSGQDPSVHGPSVEINSADLYRSPPHLSEDLRGLMYEMYQLKVSVQHVQVQMHEVQESLKEVQRTQLMMMDYLQSLPPPQGP